MNVPMKHDADRARVVVHRVTAAHVRAVQLTGVRSTARIVRGPTSFVEPTLRVDQPVVLDVDVLAAVERVRVDAAARAAAGVGRIARRPGVVHDELLDDGVVVRCTARARLRSHPTARA